MNREQNLQIRLGCIAGKIEQGDQLDEGERTWLVDLLMMIGRGDDIRDVAGFRTQKGTTASEKPFWVSVHYRVLRNEKVTASRAMREVTTAWTISEATAADYIRKNVKEPREFISIATWPPGRLLALAQWRASCEKR